MHTLLKCEKLLFWGLFCTIPSHVDPGPGQAVTATSFMMLCVI